MSDQSKHQTCMTCTFSIWGVGLGLGFVCRNELKIIEEGTQGLFNIPRRTYVCTHYVARPDESSSDDNN